MGCFGDRPVFTHLCAAVFLEFLVNTCDLPFSVMSVCATAEHVLYTSLSDTDIPAPFHHTVLGAENLLDVHKIHWVVGTEAAQCSCIL